MASADVQINTDEVVRKAMASTQIDKEAIREAYSEVRDDKSDISWVVFKYEGHHVRVAATGTTFDEFKSQFEDDERAFAYIRLQTGDEMSRRAKFMFVAWVGTEVSPIKRAKMSTDKALIKDVVSNFAVELTIESSAELDEKLFREELMKAGGANYGTGIRD